MSAGDVDAFWDRTLQEMIPTRRTAPRRRRHARRRRLLSRRPWTPTTRPRSRPWHRRRTPGAPAAPSLPPPPADGPASPFPRGHAADAFGADPFGAPPEPARRPAVPRARGPSPLPTASAGAPHPPPGPPPLHRSQTARASSCDELLVTDRTVRFPPIPHPPEGNKGGVNRARGNFLRLSPVCFPPRPRPLSPARVTG